MSTATTVQRSPLAAVVDLDADGQVRVQVAGEVTTRTTTDLRAARHAAQTELVDAARRGRRPVRATVTEPAGAFLLEVDLDGSVRNLSHVALRVVRTPRRRVLATTARAATSTPEASDRALPAPPAAAGAEGPGDHAARFDWTQGPLGSLFQVRACRRCGCTEEQACPSGCWWVEEDLCSACLAAATAPALDAVREAATPVPKWSSVVPTEVGIGAGEPAPVNGGARLDERPSGKPRRSRRRPLLVVAAVAAASGLAVAVALVTAGGPAPGEEVAPAWHAAVAEQAALDAAERVWNTDREVAARAAASAAVLRARVEAARAVIEDGRLTLEGTPQADDDLRAQLDAVLADLDGRLDAGGAPASWLALVQQARDLQEQVTQSQALWQQAEDARLAAERDAAAQSAGSARQGSAAGSAPSAGSGNSSRQGTGSIQAQQPPAAAPQAPSTGASVRITASPVATGSDRPGVARVNVSVEGNQTVTVTFSVAGHSAVIGTVDGSGSLIGEITALPAGRHSWTVSGGGVTASGSIQVF